MYAWRWSTGEPYYKSSKTNNPKNAPKNAVNQSNDTVMTEFYPSREELDTKIANRESIPQRGINPFLQNSYIHDIVSSDQFLKPMNTSTDTIKSHERT
jgi:hypothetical protein